MAAIARRLRSAGDAHRADLHSEWAADDRDPLEDNSINETAFVVSNGNEERRLAANQTTYSWAVDPGSYMCVTVKAGGEHGDSAWFPNYPPWYVCTTTPAG